MDNKDGIITYVFKTNIVSKNIAVFGCSWSYGVPAHSEQSIPYDCWPLHFAKKYPDYIVYNFSKGGTGIGYHIAILHKFLNSKQYNNETKIVFQITLPYRYTFNVDDLINIDLVLQNNNYWYYDTTATPRTVRPDVIQGLTRPRHWDNGSRLATKQIGFYKKYMKYYPEIYRDIEFESQIAYVKNICNFVYAHQYWLSSNIPVSVKQKYNTIPIVRDIIGEEKFNEFVFDNGAHFGPQGLKYMTKWIKGKLNV